MADDAWGGLVNRRSVPGILLGLAALLLFLSFFVGWFSVDATLRRWAFDESNPDGEYVGASLGNAQIDLEMKMLSIDTQAKPTTIQSAIESSPNGPPSYDNNAGRMGTVMLGVLILMLVVLANFVFLLVLYVQQHRGRGQFGDSLRRLFVLFVVLGLVTILYFSFRIGPAARDDEEQILRDYPFSDEVAYAALKPDIGFWKTWQSDRRTVLVPNGGRQVWEFEVESNPSAGWWLLVTSLGLSVAAWVVATREGEFDGLQPTGSAPPPAGAATG